MRVLHVIPSLSHKHGGPSVALVAMARGLTALGVELDVATTNDDGPGSKLPVRLGIPIAEETWTVRYFEKQNDFYKISVPFSRWINRNVSGYDLVHVHALFSHTSISACRAAARSRTPYVVRPLGSLNRWGMENRRPWLKQLSLRLLELPALKHASAMHYTSVAERTDAEQAGVEVPAAVVPLGIDLRPFRMPLDSMPFWKIFPEIRNRRVILFLSRIHPVKGLDMLLPAFMSIVAEERDAVLVIVGEGDAKYVNAIKGQASVLGLGGKVFWAGHLNGLEKMAAFAAATLFVLPSYSENFGVALIEALAAGCPCVTTEGVAVASYVKDYDAGIVVKAEVAGLAIAMGRLLRDDVLRRRYSANAQKLVQDNFSIEAMGLALRELYRTVLS